MHSTVTRESSSIDAVVEGLAAGGIAIVSDFLPAAEIAALRAEALRRDRAGELVPAGVGRGEERGVRDDVRGDRIRWLDEEGATPPERALFAALGALRVAVNRELMLGLWRYEGHYALYPPGAFYAKHVDRFRDDDARTLSLVLYLNEAWTADDGGALRLWLPHERTRDVLPLGGTLAAFLSANVPHEVLPAARPRLAVTGWFRRREN
jgi:SM-20-related protein